MGVVCLSLGVVVRWFGYSVWLLWCILLDYGDLGRLVVSCFGYLVL